MHRSSSLLAGALAALALPACGSRGIGDLRLVVASTLDPATGACGTDLRLSELSADFLRVSVRRRDPGGAAAALCDAIVPSGGEASLAIAAPAGSRVDLWVEAFAGAGAARKRLASGALLDVDPTVALPALRLLPSEGFRCAPGARLALGRAFHSATPLPGGQVLFIGGLTPSSDGSAGPAAQNGALYVTPSIEVYEPATASFYRVSDGAPVARAFHHAAVVGQAADGRVTLLVSPGLGASAATNPVLADNADGAAPIEKGFRWYFLPAATVAPAELLVYDPAARAIVSHQPASPSLPAAVLMAAAPLAEGGLAIAGGLVPRPPTDPTSPFGLAVAVSRDGASAAVATIDAPRVGAALVPLPDRDAAGHTARAVLVGGATQPPSDPGPPPPPSPLELVDLAAPAATPIPIAPDAERAMLPPAYVLPTVTLLDLAPALPTRRLLLSGGLELVPGANGPTATQPPSATMQLVTLVPPPPASPPNPAEVAPVAPTSAWTIDPLCAAAHRYKPVAFDAATLLPSRDRVLSTGGTPRSLAGCNDCEGGDRFGCALAQAAIVSFAADAAPALAPAAAPLEVARYGHSQTLLPDGTVLVAGGFTRRPGPGGAQTWSAPEAELWNPARATPAAPMPVGSAAPGPMPLLDPDDPLHDDLAAQSLSRSAGDPAWLAGDATRTPARRCGQPQ